MDITELLRRVSENILNPLLLAMFLVAVAYFVFGLVSFIANAGSEEARSKGKSHMLWSIVGMVIMISAYAILAMVTGSFGINMPF